MKKTRCALGIVSIWLSAVSALPAQSPSNTIPFQGYLTDDVGNPLTDVVSITFKLYQPPNSGAVWTEVHPSVGVVDGVFDVTLGSITPLDDLIFNRQHDLGISVDGDPEIAPRTPLRSAPFAMSLRGALGIQLVDDEIDVFASDNIVGGKGWVDVDAVGVAVLGGGNSDDFEKRNRGYGNYGTIGGGWGNAVGGNDFTATEPTDNQFATVGGGYRNEAFGAYSTIPGGYRNNTDGSYGFAAGYRAKSLHRGSFVWSDSSGTDFTSSGDWQFLIRAKGGVGIGTGYPGGQFVKARPTQSATYQLELRNEGSITTPNFDGIRFTQVTLPSDTPTNLAWIKVPYLNFGGVDMEFGLRFHDEPILYLKNTGNIEGSPVRVGVGTSNPSHELDVNGDIEAVSLSETSDARYKRDVSELSNALEAILSLQGVRFYWDRDSHPEKAFSDDAQLGFLAQDVQEVVPEVVSEGDDGSLSVAYGKLVPLLVEAIKQQQARIETLESEIAAIRAGM